MTQPIVGKKYIINSNGIICNWVVMCEASYKYECHVRLLYPLDTARNKTPQWAGVLIPITQSDFNILTPEKSLPSNYVGDVSGWMAPKKA